MNTADRRPADKMDILDQVETLYHAEMKTLVKGISYDFVTKKGRVDMLKGCCADMKGCIDFFARLDKDVMRVNIFAGDRPDTSSVNCGNDSWMEEDPE
jgi:hypothetical protein